MSYCFNINSLFIVCYTEMIFLIGKIYKVWF